MSSTKPKYDWATIEKYFGKLTDTEMADRFDTPRKLISNRRIAKGIKVVRKWSRHEHLLGVMPDKDLASMIGLTPNAVTVKRIRLGIPCLNSKPEGEVETFFCSMLKEPFERQVDTPLGRVDILTPTTIYECKYKLNLSGLHRAIGQLVCYGNTFPDRQKILVYVETSISPDITLLLDSLGIEILQIACPIKT